MVVVAKRLFLTEQSQRISLGYFAPIDSFVNDLIQYEVTRLLAKEMQT